MRSDGTTATSFTYETTTSRLKAVTDPKGQVTTYTYNRDGTVAQTAYTNAEHATPAIGFTYDPNYRRLASMTDGTGTTTYAYKAIGTLGATQLASVDGPLSNDTMAYDYDEIGRAASRAINGVSATDTFDALGRVRTSANVLGSFTYTYVGNTARMQTVTYPNGQTSAYSYLGHTSDDRLQSILHRRADNSRLSQYDYTYDATGQIATWTQQSEANPATMYRFAYDPAGQLTTATRQTTDATPTILKRYVYAYDGAGNRASEQIDDAVTGATFNAQNQLVSQQPSGALVFAGSVSEAATVTIAGKPATVTADYQFSGTAPVTAGTTTVTIAATDTNGNTTTNQYQVDAAGASRTLTYDANGNLTGDGTRTFTWDTENRLLSVVSGTKMSDFTYDGLDRRVRIVEKDGGVTTSDTRFVWCGLQICEARDASGASVLKRFFPQGVQEGGVSYFYTRDHLGSVREVTGSTGAQRARYDFDPWGRRTKLSGDKDADFGFTGHYEHTPSGLTLALFRAYDASLGRWISEDPAGRVNGPNLYSYVLGNPVNRFDRFGLFSDGDSEKQSKNVGIGEYLWDQVVKACTSAVAALSGRVGAVIAAEEMNLRREMEAGTKIKDKLQDLQKPRVQQWEDILDAGGFPKLPKKNPNEKPKVNR